MTDDLNMDEFAGKPVDIDEEMKKSKRKAAAMERKQRKMAKAVCPFSEEKTP